jgi:cobalamin biosynthesis protein CobT
MPPQLLRHRQIMLNCLKAAVNADDDAEDSSDEESDDDTPESDDVLDHDYEITCVKDETNEKLNKATEKAHKDHIQDLRRLSVGSCFHRSISILTCA